MEGDRRTETVGARGGPQAGHGRIELLALGTRLAERFEILDVLGTGGYAVVYRARDRALGREVALKVLRHDRISQSALRRLRREAAIARDVVHPRLVRIFDIEEAGEAVFLAMEIVEGGALGDRLSEGRLPIEQAVRWAAQALEGLAALHALGILHRDVKPGNLLIDSAGDLKVTDFGLALHLDRDETRATTHESVLGTLEYLSPEQALGRPVDARSDLYSLGVVFYEMVAGRLPFDAQSSLGSLLERLKNESLPDLREVRPETPPWLAATVAKLLAREPGERYLSAEAALTELHSRTAKRPRRPHARWLLAGAAALLIVAGSWLYRGYRQSRFSHVVIEQSRDVRALDFAGRTLWKRENVRPVYNFVPLRMRGGGLRLATFPGTHAEFVSTGHSNLELLDPQTGRSRGTLPMPSLHEHFTGFADRYTPVLDAVDLDEDGYDELVAGFNQVPYYPFYFVLSEPAIGRSRTLFAAAGHHRLAGAADLDGDGHRDLLLSGINNKMGWINGIGAVRVDPWLDDTAWRPRDPVAAATPDLELSEMEPNIALWYTLLPSRYRVLASPKVRVDPARRELLVPIGDETVRLDFDGFRIDSPSRLPPADRLRARRDAFAAMREGNRLLQNEHATDAIVVFDGGRAAAERANEPTIVEWLDRLAARARLRAGLRADGLQRFEQLWASSELASDVAYEAATELHASGDVVAAVDWYRRALSRGAAQETGRNKFEVAQTLVVALAELGRQAEAVQAIERFEQVHNGAPMTRERAFLAWYFGGAPDPDLIPGDNQMEDIHSYWRLELLLAAGTPPLALLDQVRSAREASPQSRPLFDGLEAELLSRLGRDAEALPLARQATEQARLGAPQNLLFRAHWKLLEERLRRIEKAATRAS